MPLRRLHQPISGIPARFHKAIVKIPAGAIVQMADGPETIGAMVVLWNGRRITVCSRDLEENSEPLSVWKSENTSHRRTIRKRSDTPIDGFDPRPNAAAVVLRSAQQIHG